METVLHTNAPAPDFSLPDLKGRLHSLSEYRGRIVTINFWSAECPWSMRADKDLARWLPEWGERVVYLPVAPNANEPPGMLGDAAHQRKLPLVLVDAGAAVVDRFGAQATPHLFVIDAEGILRYQGAFNNFSFGLRTPTQFFLKEAVEALLTGRLPEVVEARASGCPIVRHRP